MSGTSHEHIWTYFTLYSTGIIDEFEQINACWVWETMVSDNNFFFSNCEKYMGWGNLFGYMFSSLFTQHKVAKGFTTAFQKDKSNPVVYTMYIDNIYR